MMELLNTACEIVAVFMACAGTAAVIYTIYHGLVKCDF